MCMRYLVGISMRRRDFIGASLVAGSTLLRFRPAIAIGKDSKFRFGHLRLGRDPDQRSTALRRMAWELEKRTSIETEGDAKRISLGGSDLHETPLLYLAGDREFAIPLPEAISRLRAFLTYGGFLLIDSAEGSTEGAFDGSVRQLIDAVYPRPSFQTGLELIPKDHVIYKSFYLINRPVGRLALSPTMEGVFRDGRLVIAYIQNDLAGAWARDSFGNYLFPCEPDGERQREMSFRLGVNMVMYAMCLDYKTDQVHVPFIMRRRRWRPNDGAEKP